MNQGNTEQQQSKTVMLIKVAKPCRLSPRTIHMSTMLTSMTFLHTRRPKPQKGKNT